MRTRNQNTKRRTKAAQRASTKSAKPPREVEVPELFQVLVSCGDEDAQRRLYERLTAEGYECRVVTL